MTTDPAVDIWTEAIAALRGVQASTRPPTYYEAWQDDWLENIAEERAAYNRGDYATEDDDNAASDAYERGMNL